MHLFFAGSQADSTPFKTGWLTSENIKKPRHGIDNHYLNLEYNPTVLTGMCLKRSDGTQTTPLRKNRPTGTSLPDTVDDTALSLAAALSPVPDTP